MTPRTCHRCGALLGHITPVAFAGGTVPVLKMGQAGVLDTAIIICLCCGAENDFRPNLRNMVNCMVKTGTIQIQADPEKKD